MPINWKTINSITISRSSKINPVVFSASPTGNTPPIEYITHKLNETLHLNDQKHKRMTNWHVWSSIYKTNGYTIKTLQTIKNQKLKMTLSLRYMRMKMKTYIAWIEKSSKYPSDKAFEKAHGFWIQLQRKRKSRKNTVLEKNGLPRSVSIDQERCPIGRKVEFL